MGLIWVQYLMNKCVLFSARGTLNSLIEFFYYGQSHQTLRTHRKEEPLRSTGFEEFLPLLGVLTGEGDGVRGVVKPGLEDTGPQVQLRENTQGTDTSEQDRFDRDNHTPAQVQTSNSTASLFFF